MKVFDGSCRLKRAALLLAMVCLNAPAMAATLTFSGPLRVVLDGGGAVYSGVPLGTFFSGEMDSDTFSGFISDGTTVTSFSCCIAAGGLSVSNDETLDADAAASANDWWGTSFAAGNLVDLIDIEADAPTAGNGRIEVGLSFMLGADSFDDDSLGNYPPDPADVLGIAFFIAEFDAQNTLIYDGLGSMGSMVPLPPAVWLFGVAGLAAFRRRAIRN